MRQLVKELATDYQDKMSYQMLSRVYDAHFGEVESGLRAKVGEEVVKCPFYEDKCLRRIGKRLIGKRMEKALRVT